MIRPERGWPLMRVLESRFRLGNRFDCRRTNEAMGHDPLHENELQPAFGFVRAQFPRRPDRMRGILSRLILSGPIFSACRLPASPALQMARPRQPGNWVCFA